MNISSGLNTVSSLYGQQKSNYMKAPASAEKTFYTAETPAGTHAEDDTGKEY